MRILVIDDNPVLLKLMRAVLESEGHRVAVADGGQAGIDAFMEAREHSDPFAMVMSDLGMPNVDGHKVAMAVKAISRETAVVLFTGWGLQMQLENRLPPNVDHVLPKPPRLAELREVVAAVAGS